MDAPLPHGRQGAAGQRGAAGEVARGVLRALEIVKVQPAVRCRCRSQGRGLGVGRSNLSSVWRLHVERRSAQGRPRGERVERHGLGSGTLQLLDDQLVLVRLTGIGAVRLRRRLALLQALGKEGVERLQRADRFDVSVAGAARAAEAVLGAAVRCAVAGCPGAAVAAPSKRSVRAPPFCTIGVNGVHTDVVQDGQLRKQIQHSSAFNTAVQEVASQRQLAELRAPAQPCHLAEVGHRIPLEVQDLYPLVPPQRRQVGDVVERDVELAQRRQC
mmetsp:Transcript_7092/g.21573  ORF Transcript_7092/g.21573 Transcript_7092/m.21573 type:complete len:272 (+) Transcript_7092:536-1351(+)